MGIIACTFQCPRHIAHVSTAFNIAHAATEAHGISGDESLLSAGVAHLHPVEFVAPLVEVERSEIHPCAAAHGLIYVELGGLSLVPNGVERVVYASRHGLVAHVNSMWSLFFQLRCVANGAAPFFVGFRHETSSCTEGVVTV